MQLLVVRHAIAEEREQFRSSGQDDALRPLTEGGRRKMERVALGLRRIVKTIDLIATSPFVRAAQTAAIVAHAYGDIAPITADELSPHNTPASLVVWLRRHEEAEVVAVVGHEPDLGILITWLLAGLAEPRVPLRKGGAALLDIATHPAPGAAVVRWVLTPALLRTLAD